MPASLYKKQISSCSSEILQVLWWLKGKLVEHVAEPEKVACAIAKSNFGPEFTRAIIDQLPKLIPSVNNFLSSLLHAFYEVKIQE